MSLVTILRCRDGVEGSDGVYNGHSVEVRNGTDNGADVEVSNGVNNGDGVENGRTAAA